MNPDVWKQALEEHSRQLTALNRELTKAHKLKSPHSIRMVTIAALRPVHLVKLTLRAFWKVKPQKQFGIAAPRKLMDILRHKNTPILLTIYYFTKAHDIPLDHWFQAQFDILSKMPQLWITCFSGQKAFERYTDWDYRLSRKFTRLEDRQENAIPLSLQKTIHKAIFTGHKQALTWQPRLKDLHAPTLSAALAYINTYVPAWYLVAHKCFRDDVLEPGLMDPPQLIKIWNHYKKSSWAKKFCQEALDAAELQYGTLEL